MNRLILVDDDELNLGLMKMFLELEGYEVTACLNIEQAKSAASKDVQAFIIDVHLRQNQTGIDLLREVRSGQLNCKKNVVVIISSGDTDSEAIAYQAGANKFFHKPFSPQEITMKLNNLLTEAQARG